MSCRGSETTTRHKDAEIHIKVAPVYLSSVDDGDKHWFAYTITISNRSDDAVQLLSRYWRIADSNNNIREVTGEGVVGKQPRINSGEQFQYTSYVDLTASVGDMMGRYTMKTATGECFQADISTFLLSLPGALQ